MLVDGRFLRQDGETLSVDEGKAIEGLDAAVSVYYDGLE
jgi:hypothetical protein